MRVLIVEDELHVRTFLCRAVKCLLPSASILAEPDGLQALRSFLANPADLIISDNRMPQMSGLELLCTLRKPSMPGSMMS
ncbi:MAG: response regulator, partial [Oscillochloris sp.]|nr:response regulator [Oscillochloris sp.]